MEEHPHTEENSGVLLLRLVFYFTLMFSISELFAAYFSNSILLFEESIHMFADSVSFGLNLWAERVSLRAELEGENGERNKLFGQMVGTGVSALTLIATLFVVFIESVRRLTYNESSETVDSSIMLGFGITLSTFHLSCLLAYFCGINILHSHSHSHGGGSHGHSHNSYKKVKELPENKSFLREEEKHSHGHSHNHNIDSDDDHHCSGYEKSERSENLVSAIFHVFVDFLHSFLVIVTALFVKFSGVDDEDKADADNNIFSSLDSGKVDAISSLLLCVVIFSGSVIVAKSFWRQFKVYTAMDGSVLQSEESHPIGSP
eukprot:snap_masked-scaffold_9-processed-gene-3.11-mRNA-1 protein AED:1.00 eAED:1.00 QI:0/-1/0/0/-1/1/1/0/316